MNISQHTFFPNKWKDGQWSYDGISGTNRGKCMTHWFPIDTTNMTIFMLPSNSIALYGQLVSSSSPNTFPALINTTIMPWNGTIQDRFEPSASSKPFTYILY